MSHARHHEGTPRDHALLLDHLEKNGHDEVEIDEDYHWYLQRPDVYDPSKVPDTGKLTLGQLFFDWKEAQGKKESPRVRARLAGHDLAEGRRASSLLTVTMAGRLRW